MCTFTWVEGVAGQKSRGVGRGKVGTSEAEAGAEAEAERGKVGMSEVSKGFPLQCGCCSSGFFLGPTSSTGSLFLGKFLGLKGTAGVLFKLPQLPPQIRCTLFKPVQ